MVVAKALIKNTVIFYKNTNAIVIFKVNIAYLNNKISMTTRSTQERISLEAAKSKLSYISIPHICN